MWEYGFVMFIFTLANIYNFCCYYKQHQRVIATLNNNDNSNSKRVLQQLQKREPQNYCCWYCWRSNSIVNVVSRFLLFSAGHAFIVEDYGGRGITHILNIRSHLNITYDGPAWITRPHNKLFIIVLFQLVYCIAMYLHISRNKSVNCITGPPMHDINKTLCLWYFGLLLQGAVALSVMKPLGADLEVGHNTLLTGLQAVFGSPILSYMRHNLPPRSPRTPQKRPPQANSLTAAWHQGPQQGPDDSKDLPREQAHRTERTLVAVADGAAVTAGIVPSVLRSRGRVHQQPQRTTSMNSSQSSSSSQDSENDFLDNVELADD